MFFPKETTIFFLFWSNHYCFKVASLTSSVSNEPKRKMTFCVQRAAFPVTMKSFSYELLYVFYNSIQK